MLETENSDLMWKFVYFLLLVVMSTKDNWNKYSILIYTDFHPLNELNVVLSKFVPIPIFSRSEKRKSKMAGIIFKFFRYNKWWNRANSNEICILAIETYLSKRYGHTFYIWNISDVRRKVKGQSANAQ